MIEIDGSYLEGGGQILRTSVALSSILKKPIKVYNIRKNRPKPGLKAQHLTGIKVLAELTNAQTKNLFIGSQEIEFFPKEIKVSEFKKIDIGTAGSISLLLQTLLPVIIFGNKKITFEIIGGTSGLGAPNIEYTKYVTLWYLEKMGVKNNLEIIKQGFYPKGGGRVKITIQQVKKLNSLKIDERGELKRIFGFSIVGSLPKHIAVRQAKSAEKIIEQEIGVKPKIGMIVEKTFSPGTSLTLIAEYENCVLGSDARGEKGKPAEKVGEEVAKKLISSINSNASLDLHMADQILPFVALACNESYFTIEKQTNHFKTNLYIIEKFLGKIFEIDERIFPNKVFSKGICFIRK